MYMMPSSEFPLINITFSFKGGEYLVQGVARHSETGEQLVVYSPCYGEGGLWGRPRWKGRHHRRYFRRRRRFSSGTTYEISMV